MDLMFRHGMTPTQRLMWLKRLAGGGGGSSVIKTVKAALIHITDALAKPAKKFVVNLEPIQASGTPTPENPLPITGHTGANVTRTGKNLRGGIDFANDFKARYGNATINTDDKTVSFPSTTTATDTSVYIPSFKVKDNTRYTFIITISNSTIAKANLRIVYTDGTSTNFPDLSSTSKQTIVVTTADNKTFKSLTSRNQGGTTVIYYDESGVFEGVLTADDFEPYQGTTIPITFPDSAGTVYGGTLTFEDGEWKLVVDMVMKDLGAATWTASGVGTTLRAYRSQLSHNGKYATDENAFALSDTYKYSGVLSTFPNNTTVDNRVANGVYLYGTSSSKARTHVVITLPVANTYEDISGILVYQLKTPIEYTLTESQALTLLQGENNIWVDDSDSLELTYYAKAEETTP